MDNKKQEHKTPNPQQKQQPQKSNPSTPNKAPTQKK